MGKVTINVNGLSLVHQNSGGIATATLPDVCNTQAGPVVVPVPYPNIAMSIDLAMGSKNVLVDGGNSAAILGSEFSKSTGDEPGSVGGVMSGINKSRAIWLTSSFDVMIAGKGACRLTDKMLMNNGNTACLSGTFNPEVMKSALNSRNKVIEAEIIKVAFHSRTRVAVDQYEVTAPHWSADNVPFYDQHGYGVFASNLYGACAKAPAAYSIKDKNYGYFANVEINVTTLENISGNAILTGILDGLNLASESEQSLKLGSNVFRVKIKNPPDCIKWYKGPINWLLEVKSESETKILNSTFVEVFFILDKPAQMYYSEGVWAEALRFLCNRVKIMNEKEERAVATLITKYCHERHHLKYDSIIGRSHFGVQHSSTGGFKLKKYLEIQSKKANCYDQAAAIQTLCGAVGIQLKWIIMHPFGYIHTKSLLGYGECNNPFFTDVVDKLLRDPNNTKRRRFNCHAFCNLESAMGPVDARGEGLGWIYDACTGPYTGGTKRQYVWQIIDTKTTLYKHFGYRPGTAGRPDMQDYHYGVTGLR